MQGSNNENLNPQDVDKTELNTPEIVNGNENNQTTIVQTNEGVEDGQTKCPSCGSTDISLNKNVGKLRCHFCRHEFEPEKFEKAQTDISQLQGQIIGSGAQDIIADAKDVLTFKCQSCGAEVVIDTNEAAQGRCHWCRMTLSINQQIPNGAIPDMVLPFTVTKEAARAQIEEFVRKRKFFAHPQFQAEFTTENIMGVYLPYMVIDINAHAKLAGQGERLVRTYSVGSGNNQSTRYDADLYDVQREFDLVVDSLTVEASSDKLEHHSSEKTNNVINAIMPFDTENSVKWNANYLRGYTSQKRDITVEQLTELVNTQAKDISRHRANETLKEYNRGVAWSAEQMDVKGKQWKAAYLPVWLYSYQSIKGDKKLLHYVAVNARSEKTMGSIPINMTKLLIFSGIAQVIGIIIAMLLLWVDVDLFFLAFASGPIYFGIYYAKYRNLSARHRHELDTKSNIANIQASDNLVGRRKGLTSPTMAGANNHQVSNDRTGMGWLKNMVDQSTVNTIAQSINSSEENNDNNQE